MEYMDIFTLPPWETIILSVFQTAAIFCLIMIGLQLIGRRVFAQRGPQDLIIIVLVAEACDLGLSHEDAGFWGSVASVLTLFALGYASERISFIRHLMDKKPVLLFKNGKLHENAMKKNMIDEHDLEEVAREQGRYTYRDFDTMMLEGDGQISAIHFQNSKGD
jgi:uncharacterized membrane protein YcaP (DUF421 family)